MCGSNGNARIALVHGTIGDVVSTIAGVHFGGRLPLPFTISATLRIGFMFPMSLPKPIPPSFPLLASSLDGSAPGIFDTPAGLKAERTPGWKPMLLSTDGVAPRLSSCPWCLAAVTLMSRALSCSSELLFFDSPALIKKDEGTALLPESEWLCVLLGDVDVFGMSPDFGDLLNVSVPLACCSLCTKPRPLLSAQWKWTWALSVFGNLNILQQYQQM